MLERRERFHDSWKGRHSEGSEKNVYVSSATIGEFETLTARKDEQNEVVAELVDAGGCHKTIIKIRIN